MKFGFYVLKKNLYIQVNKKEKNWASDFRVDFHFHVRLINQLAKHTIIKISVRRIKREIRWRKIRVRPGIQK
jgi:hypothetical protein